MPTPTSNGIIIDVVDSPAGLRVNVVAPPFYEHPGALALLAARQYAKSLLGREVRLRLKPGPVTILSDGRREHHFAEPPK